MVAQIKHMLAGGSDAQATARWSVVQDSIYFGAMKHKIIESQMFSSLFFNYITKPHNINFIFISCFGRAGLTGIEGKTFTFFQDGPCMFTITFILRVVTRILKDIHNHSKILSKLSCGFKAPKWLH